MFADFTDERTERTMIQSIIKRDGRVVLYDQNKIAAAILKAMEVSGDGNAADAARVANDVQRELENSLKLWQIVLEFP